ncbi:lipopolysaccharide biosynthesis protein [Chloroflexota bacterium]
MKEKIIPLFKQSAVYSLGRIAGPLVGIFMVPIYTRVFAPDDYGILSLVNVTIIFFGLLVLFGMDSSMARYYMDPKDDHDRILTASTGLFFRATVFVAGAAIIICFSQDISQLIFKTDAYNKYFVIAAATLPFAQCASLCLHMFRFNFRSKTYAVISTARIVLSISLTIFFVVGLKWGITGVFASHLIIAAILLFNNLLLTKRYFHFTFSMRRLKELLHFGIPLIPYGITDYLLQNCDRYFLSYFATIEQVGLYSLGAQVASILIILFIGAGLAWTPFVFSTYKEAGIKSIYSRVMGYFIAATFLLVIALSLFSREIIIVFTTPQYYGASIVVPILALYLAFHYIGLHMSIGITISKKTFHFTWISVTVAVLNIGLNFLLVPPYGMLGAALATLISSIMWFLLLLFISQRYYYINYRLPSFIKILFVALVIISINYLLLAELNLQNVLIKIGLVGISLVCLYISGLIGKDELKYVRSLARKVIHRSRIGQ